MRPSMLLCPLLLGLLSACDSGSTSESGPAEDLLELEPKGIRGLEGSHVKLAGAVGSTAYIARAGHVEAFDHLAMREWSVPVEDLRDLQVVGSALHGITRPYCLVGQDCDWALETLSLEGESMQTESSPCPSSPAPLVLGTDDLVQWGTDCKLDRLIGGVSAWSLDLADAGGHCPDAPIVTPKGTLLVSVVSGDSTEVKRVSAAGEVVGRVSIEGLGRVAAVDEDGSIAWASGTELVLFDDEGVEVWREFVGVNHRAAFDHAGDVALAHVVGHHLAVSTHAREDGRVIAHGEVDTGLDELAVASVVSDDAGGVFVLVVGGGDLTDPIDHWLARFAPAD